MNIEIPHVTKDFEVLDFMHTDTASDTKTTVLEDGSVKEFAKQSYGFIVRLTPKNSYFIIIKQYYKTGNIKEKGVVFNSGFFKTGNWFYFDAPGKLTSTEDNDKGYEFNFNKVYEYLSAQHIDITRGHIDLYSGFHTTVEKEVQNKNAVWIIQWLKEPLLVEEIILDGKNGRVLSKNHVQRTES